MAAIDNAIVQMEQTKWFKTLNHYPKNLEQLKLMVSIVDVVGIMDDYNLRIVVSMDKTRLDMLFIILKIINKVFDKYLNYVVNKIFRNRLEEVFPCSNLTYYDLFFDQLVQDIDHFICSTIQKNRWEMDNTLITKHFIEYLQLTFGKTFYENSIKKLVYQIDAKFYEQHHDLFLDIISEFIDYTRETFVETYDSMKIFLNIIFSSESSSEEIEEIQKSLERHINIEELLNETSLEFDIYSDLKPNDIA